MQEISQINIKPKVVNEMTSKISINSKLEKIDKFFEDLTIKDYEEMAIKAGMNKVSQGRISLEFDVETITISNEDLKRKLYNPYNKHKIDNQCKQDYSYNSKQTNVLKGAA